MRSNAAEICWAALWLGVHAFPVFVVVAAILTLQFNRVIKGSNFVTESILRQ